MLYCPCLPMHAMLYCPCSTAHALLPMPAHACLLDADWCLRSDVAPDSRPQVILSLTYEELQYNSYDEESGATQPYGNFELDLGAVLARFPSCFTLPHTLCHMLCLVYKPIGC